MARLPARIELTTEEEATLRQWLRQGTSEQRLVERARVILLSHEGLTVQKVAERLATRPARVSKWRQRFAQSRMEGLADAPRSGKPNKYTEDTEKRVLKMSTSRHRRDFHSGMENCWHTRCEMSAETISGEFCGGAAFNSSGGAVGALQPIRSSARKPPMWSVSI